MKYMTFNSSCSYAGLANMLSCYGIDTTDRQIALDMKLPYLFAYEDGNYLSGPSLQTAPWFNLYLNPRGFELKEISLPKDEVSAYLQNQKCAMLGIYMENAGKHAVVYTGSAEDSLQFLNNKWESDPVPENLPLTEAELLQRIDSYCVVATLQQILPTPAPIRERMMNSITVLQDYLNHLTTVCNQAMPTAQLRQMLNSTFRALLLDGITMLDMIGETELHGRLAGIQRALLTALRTDAAELRLAEHLSVDQLSKSITDYLHLIRSKI